MRPFQPTYPNAKGHTHTQADFHGAARVTNAGSHGQPNLLWWDHRGPFRRDCGGDRTHTRPDCVGHRTGRGYHRRDAIFAGHGRTNSHPNSHCDARANGYARSDRHACPY